MTQLLDLAPSDVHVTGPLEIARGKKKPRVMSEISGARRKRLPTGQFADPANRKYPIHDKAHADNAAARLEQQKGSMSPDKYRAIKSRIGAAQKRFGEPSKSKKMRGGKGLRMAVTHPDGTRFEVRHMSDEAPTTVYVFRRLDKQQALAEPDETGHVWIQLAESGEWHGHPQGKFQLNTAIFEQIIRNFRNTRNKRTPIDFEHASEMPPSSGNIPVVGAPAQGWIHDLKQSDSKLFAYVQWKALARQYILEDKYAFISPAIRFNAKDRVTGEKIGAYLSSAGLTNQPFLDGLMPMAASEGASSELAAAGYSVNDDDDIVQMAAGGMCYSAHEFMPRIKAALRLPELATATECSDHLARLREHFDAAGGDAQGMHEGINLGDYMLPMRQLANPPMGATWEHVFDTVQDLIDAAIDEHELEMHGDQVAASMTGTDEENDTDDAAESASEDSDEQPMETKTMAAKPTDQTVQPPAEQTAVPPAPAVTMTQANPAESSFAGLMLKNQTLEVENRRLALENRQLREDKLMLENEQVAADVSEAFETYKDTRHLNEHDRDTWMLENRQQTPGTFHKQFPKIPSSQQHLLRKFTSDGRTPTGTKPAPRVTEDSPTQTEDVTRMSLRQLSRQIARKRGISIGQAQIEASRFMRAQLAKRTG